MIRIILVDDHKIFLDGLSALLKKETDIEVMAEALRGDEVLPLVRAHQPDIVVLDITMPGMDGIEVSRQLRQHFPEIRILMLTMHDDPDFIYQLEEIEVEGYILKNKGSEQLVEALRSIANGGTYFGQEAIVAFRKGRRKAAEEKEIRLTRREIEILTLIAREFTTPQIASKLFIAASTVETHRRNLIAKLNVKSTLGLVRRAIEMGLG